MAASARTLPTPSALADRLGPTAFARRLERERGSSDAAGALPATGGARHRHAARLVRGALALAGLLGRAQRNVRTIGCRVHEQRLARLPREFDGCTLLQASDLHLDASPDFVEHLIAALRGVRADLCVLTGDFRFSISGPHQPALAALARLRPHLGADTYAVLGNHDPLQLVPGIEALGIRVLLNESVALRRGDAMLTLAGIDDAYYFGSHDLGRALQGRPDGGCTVLLSHAPDAAAKAAAAGVDLMLSGHTHGGQICLPGGVPILTCSRAPRRFARGPWRCGSMAGYTSVGCGTTIADVRLNCPPEVVLHRLRA